MRRKQDSVQFVILTLTRQLVIHNMLLLSSEEMFSAYKKTFPLHVINNCGGLGRWGAGH